MDVRHEVLRAAAVVCAMAGVASGCDATVILADGGAALPPLEPDDPDVDTPGAERDPDRAADGAPSPQCARYCAEAGARGCPLADDCLATCAAQYARSEGCAAQLDALLACAPEHLVPSDQLDRYFELGMCALTPYEPVPTGEDEDAAPPPAFSECEAQVEAFDTCIEDRTPALQQFADRCRITVPFLTRTVGGPRTSAGDLPNAIETAKLHCQLFPEAEQELKAWCDADGQCRCYVDHEEIATCDMLLHVAGMVVAPASCCAPMFEDALGL